jgi:hypothetical protein
LQNLLEEIKTQKITFIDDDDRIDTMEKVSYLNNNLQILWDDIKNKRVGKIIKTPIEVSDAVIKSASKWFKNQGGRHKTQKGRKSSSSQKNRTQRRDAHK